MNPAVVQGVDPNDPRLAPRVDARLVHAALVAAGLTPGKAPPPAADVAVEPPPLPGGLAFGGA